MKIVKKNFTCFIMLSLLGFILFWVLLTDAWGTSKLIFPNNIILGQYIYGYVTRIIWVLPAIFLILKYKGTTLSIPSKILLSKPRFNKFFIITLSIMLLYSCVGMFVIHKGFHINKENIVFLLIKVLIVGIVEETVFRGWGYNALSSIT